LEAAPREHGGGRGVIGLIAAVVATAALAAGCSDVDDEPSPAGASTPGASDSAITDNPSDPSESPTETAGDFDDVGPATGPALRLPGISLRLPAGWEYSRTRTEFFV
ncbi:hypothetical protein, partial [Nocardioides sp. R-C-SC26]|uniref:hypothetical protein n=1 Tax=Nocardioides sp. R-C-SC26 TaxID=2870414 RepID=UPI001E323729